MDQPKDKPPMTLNEFEKRAHAPRYAMHQLHDRPLTDREICQGSAWIRWRIMRSQPK